MSITFIIGALVLLVVAVGAFGISRDRVQERTSVQSLAVLVVVVVAVLVLVYLVLGRGQ